jgi:hypothetical protein
MATAAGDGAGAGDVIAGAGDRLLLLNGDGRGGLDPAGVVTGTRESWTAAAADLDGDGRSDVIAADAAADVVRIWYGDK